METVTNTSAITAFCKRHNITIDQFYGRVEIGGYLYLSGLTSIPEGFNPTVGGYLYLSGLTSIPEGFNPTVGGYLYLNGLTSIPEGFNPTVGGSLYLSGLTSIPEGFNPTVGGSLYLNGLTSIPEGFNPTVGGYLYLSGLTSIPEGFNPTVGGYLYLNGLTSIPEGFNPTVGGSLDLSGLTSIPEGFNPTVGGYLDLRGGSKYIGANVPEVKIELIWCDGKYTKIDGIFCEIISAHVLAQNTTVIRAKEINKSESFFIAKRDGYSAHGETMDKAIEDLQFKIASEKLKNEPINKDTIITTKHYRLITGACEFGVKDWMQKNNITKEEITAGELLPMLERTNAYGLSSFKKLVTW
jgi:hypothetical protein